MNMQGNCWRPALIWAFIFVCIVTLGLMRLTPESVRTDMRALLPQHGQGAQSSELLARVSDIAAREVWVLLSHPRLEQATQAADALKAQLAHEGLTLNSPAETFDFSELQRALLPFRAALISSDDWQWLQQADDAALLRRALRRLYRPIHTSAVSLSDDPLGLFEHALQAGQHTHNFHLEGNHLLVDDRSSGHTQSWIVMRLMANSAVSADSSQPIGRALELAQVGLQQSYPGTAMLYAGVALIGEATAAQANDEASRIGSLSTLSIVLLTVLFFARLIPIVQAVAVLAAAVLFAFCSVLAVFGEIHLITLVFGATLLGICVDYIFHFLCGCANGLCGKDTARVLAKPLSISLASSIAAYAVMAVCPMPGLQQTALFCAAGLSCTYLCVLTWMAPLTHAHTRTRAMTVAADVLKRMPRLQSTRARALFWLAVALCATAGGSQLHVRNELSLLNSIPPEQRDAQLRVNALLNPSSAGQFFVVSHTDSDTLLQSLHALRARLDALVQSGTISGFTHPAQFLSSSHSQAERSARVQQANARALALLKDYLQQDLPAATPYAQTALDIEQWLKLAPADITRLWLSPTEALVTLSGVQADSLPALREAAQGLDGVHFADTTADIAQALGQLRNTLAWSLLAILVVVGVLLRVALGQDFLRYWLPTAGALALTAGIGGLMGLPLSLFTVLPLVLVLGLGVDYAILLYTERTDSAAASVFLAASSTLLAFGLLGLSSTPALHLFGCALTIALGAVLILTVVLRPADGL